MNRRDATDVHSFYFTRFPKEMNETELWHEFKWGLARRIHESQPLYLVEKEPTSELNPKPEPLI